MPKYLVSHTIEFEIEAEDGKAAEEKSFSEMVELVDSSAGPDSLTMWDIDSRVIGD